MLIAMRPGMLSPRYEAFGGGGEKTIPPYVSNLLHWHDFSDTTTMFSDTGGLLPCTDTDAILVMTNKGYDQGYLLTASATAPNNPVLDTETNSVTSGYFDEACLCIEAGVVAAERPRTWATVFSATDAEATGYVQVHGFTANSLILAADVLSVAGTQNGTTPVTDNTVVATIVRQDADQDREAYFSTDTGDVEDTGQAVDPDGLTDLHIGALNPAGIAALTGNIYESLIWDRRLSISEIEKVKNYIANKWGVTWA